MTSTYLAGEPLQQRNPGQLGPGAPLPSLASHHMQPAGRMAPPPDPLGGGIGPAAKRPGVVEALQHHAPREQLLVSELMGWGRSSQEPTSALMGLPGAAPSGSTDFRALFARQQPQPSQQQQHPPSALYRAPSAATTGLRTFADVASRPAAAQEDLGRQEVMGALRAAYNSSSLGQGRAASQQAWPAGSLDAGGGGAGYGAAPGAAAAPAAGGSRALLENLTPEQLPVDWGIKRTLTFTSTARFTIHEKVQQAPPRTRFRAMQSVINGELDDSGGGDQGVQYLACQLSWRHPEVQMDAAALAAARSAPAAAGFRRGASGGGGGGGAGTGTALASATAGAGGGAGGAGGLLAQRLAAWRSALHSLYSTYRGGDCNVFYVVNLAARQPFVALFAHQGVRGCNELSALVSQSTRALRGRMLAAGVPFTMPLDSTAAAAAAAAGGGVGGVAGGDKAGYEATAAAVADEEADAALCDARPRAGLASTTIPQLPGASVADNSRESLLLLRGPRAVHGLYDFLMNEVSYPGLGGRGLVSLGGGMVGLGGGGGVSGEELSDLPLLLAPVPFDGGAVWRPTIKALTQNSKLTAEAAAATGDAAATSAALGGFGDPTDTDSAGGGSLLHVLQVAGGPLPPWTVRRLCGLLARHQPYGYSATLESEPASIPLNSRVLEAAAARPGADEGAAEGGAVGGLGAPQLRPTFAQGGALTLEELVAWQQPTALPGGRPMKGVVCSGSGDDVERQLSVRV